MLLFFLVSLKNFLDVKFSYCLVIMQGQVDFDDKSSWEYLFKDYWIDLKESLSLTLDQLDQAKNPWKGSDVLTGKQESPDELYVARGQIQIVLQVI